MEIWKNINGYENIYQISNEGKVKSIVSNKLRKLSFDRYVRVGLCIEKIYKTKSVHRLVAIHFVPNPENKPEVNHLDGDKYNNNDWNLEWATKSENEKHAYKLNLKKRRFGNKARNKSNLSEEQVLEILSYKEKGLKPVDI